MSIIRTALLVTAFLWPRGFASTREQPTAVTVHEWGTFTSIAGEDGRAVSWTVLDGPTDLPCFVQRADKALTKATAATVRMETPVLYFYAPHEAIVDVQVAFLQGAITEYFPRALVSPSRVHPAALSQRGSASTIAWRNVRILPGAVSEFRTESDAQPLLRGARDRRGTD